MLEIAHAQVVKYSPEVCCSIRIPVISAWDYGDSLLYLRTKV